AAEAAAATAAAESAFRLGPGFVDGERAAAHLELVQLARRLLRFFVGRHLDKGESARPACRSVTHDADRLDRSRPAEQLLQLRLSGRVRKVPDVKPSTHHSLLVRISRDRAAHSMPGPRTGWPRNVGCARNTDHREGASRT